VTTIPARCTFDGYADLVSRFKLRLLHAEYVDGEVVAYFEPRQPTLPGLPAPARSDPPAPPPAPRKPSALARHIESLLRAASARPGDVQRITLSGGLRIDVMIGVDGAPLPPTAGTAPLPLSEREPRRGSGDAAGNGETRLMLARRGKFPSGEEWSTVLTYWPYDISLDVEPEKFEYKQWRCLRAAWQTPALRGPTPEIKP
jgi:hypothetical protein